jgi:DNA anti-recombination protein RmuC
VPRERDLEQWQRELERREQALERREQALEERIAQLDEQYADDIAKIHAKYDAGFSQVLRLLERHFAEVRREVDEAFKALEGRGEGSK